MHKENEIIVIGAGVLGLSAAILFQNKYPKKRITIVAAELPTDPSPSADYASMWAGAHYRPIPRSNRQLEDEADLAFHTAKTMKKLAKETPESGVAELKGVEYLEKPTETDLLLKTGDMYAGPNDEFRILNQSELPQGVKWGCEYNSYCVNIRIYCQWLLDGFLSKGGRVIQQKLSSAKDAFRFAQNADNKPSPVVINCSGRNFDQDPKVKFIRGQTVLVKQQYDKTVTRQTADGGWACLIPRPGNGGTIVGVTKEVEDPDIQVRLNSREHMLRQASVYFPDFVDDMTKFEVVQDNVGRRPWREGGLRIELEKLDSTSRIIHGYGAGGRGYELSWGIAQRMVDMYESDLSLAAHL